MKLDPRTVKDWQIAEAAEEQMKSLSVLAHEMGLYENEFIPMGNKMAKIDYLKLKERLNNQNKYINKPEAKAKYINVTAITPTPFGEGKTTTTIGLIQGLGKCGRRASGAIRQPSSGPTFNLKGSAAGGGLSQCIPLTPLSIRLTGDIDSITNAHNLAMIALTSRMQHERNYSDERLSKSNLKRLNIDPDRITLKWAMDFCAQALRNITIGKGGKMDGFEMESGFQISVSSEIMTILSIARDLKDLRRRMGRIVVALDKHGKEITTSDLEVDGAMTAWMVDALNPNLLQTIEGQPVLVHAGPFANIGIGQSSIIADNIGMCLSEYHITESGFGSDIGFEKFWNLKCRYSGFIPDAVVIVATIRALKMHGGGPDLKAGKPLCDVYMRENIKLLDQGCVNLIAHIEIVKKSGIKPIVCINKFLTDTKEELKLVQQIAEKNGAICIVSEHWLKGGEGARELAEAVISLCEDKYMKRKEFTFLYDTHAPIRQRIERIAKQIYGASGVTYTDNALVKIKKYDQDQKTAAFGICMVKTHLSLSHNPDIKGRPIDWILPVNDVLVYRGAGLIAPVTGNIKLMPGTASNPAYRRIDVDVNTGKVKGLF